MKTIWSALAVISCAFLLGCGDDAGSGGGGGVAEGPAGTYVLDAAALEAAYVEMSQKMTEGMSGIDIDMEKTLEGARETARKEAAEAQGMEAVLVPDGTFHVTGMGKGKSVKGTWKQEGDKIVFTVTEEDGEKQDPPEVRTGSYENGVIRVRPEADMPFDLVFRKK